MKLMDVMTSPWAITPDMLREIREIYSTHLRGEKIDIKGVEARLGKQLNNETEDTLIVNGVAIIQAHGVIAKRMNLFSRISGGISTEILGDQIEVALADNKVTGVILDIDSPGGTVDGTFELADKIYSMRGEKPIVSWANGLMASAAYAIGAATDQIHISGPTAHVGSVGVVSTHIDYSGWEQKVGVKTTEIYAGKYKRIASQYEPLNAEGRESIQDAVDYLYSVFVERVAKFRNVAVATVLDDMADGRIFIGQRSIDAGLVDGESTLEALIDSLSQGQLPEPDQRAGDAQNVTIQIDGPFACENEISSHVAIALNAIDKNSHDNQSEESEMSDKPEITKGYIAEHHPDIAEAFRAEGAEQARDDGATAERERIQSVLAQSMPGHEALIEKLAFDGETTGPEAAVQILQAEKANNKQAATDLQDDAADLDKVPAATGEETDLNNLPLEDKCKAKWDASADLRDEFGGKFETYLAYEKAEEKGRVKIAGKRKKTAA